MAQLGGRGGDVFFTRVHAMRDAPGRSDAGVAGPARPPVSIAGLHVRPPLWARRFTAAREKDGKSGCDGS